MDDLNAVQISSQMAQIVIQLAAIRAVLEKLAGQQDHPYTQTKRYYRSPGLREKGPTTPGRMPSAKPTPLQVGAQQRLAADAGVEGGDSQKASVRPLVVAEL